MAKEETEQLQLIDVDDPKLAAVKRKLKAYDKLVSENREEHKVAKEKEKETRTKVFEEIQAAGLTPDSEGFYHITMDGKQWDIGQDSQLKIKKHKAPGEQDPDDDLPDEEEQAEGAEQQSRRRRVANAT